MFPWCVVRLWAGRSQHSRFVPHGHLRPPAGHHPPLLSPHRGEGGSGEAVRGREDWDVRSSTEPGVRESRHLQTGQTSQWRLEGTWWALFVCLLLVGCVCLDSWSVVVSRCYRVSYLYRKLYLHLSSTQTFTRLDNTLDWRLDLLEAGTGGTVQLTYSIYQNKQITQYNRHQR